MAEDPWWDGFWSASGGQEYHKLGSSIVIIGAHA